MDNSGPFTEREFLAAETHTPKELRQFLRDLEDCNGSTEVWTLLVNLGRALQLPFVDFISASNYPQQRKTMFVRTSYDSRWLASANEDPELARWSYFRSHAIHHLTPIAVGLEFVDDFLHFPEKRVAVLREAARRGLRSGFSIPLRVHAPPQVGLITFSGSFDRKEMTTLLGLHGWTLHAAAVAAHSRYIGFLATEYVTRNDISPKQQEMLELIGQGLQDKQIAAMLEISVSALRQRMHRLMQKTNCGNRAEIAALAMSIGLVPDPQIWSDPSSERRVLQIDGIGEVPYQTPALDDIYHLPSSKK